MATRKRYFDSTVEDKDAIASEPASYDVGTKSKGKGREPKPQTTLFVSSLPFTATSTDLSTLFSDIGPLRRAFVVTDKDTGKSKGVGYVTFALLEDAQKAEREMQGKSLDGKRKMRIEWAEKKAFGGRKKIKDEDVEGGDMTADDGEVMHIKTESDAIAPPSSSRQVTRKPADERDKDAVRTIIITGLAACQPPADDKTIYKRVRKIGDVDSVTYPAPLSIISTEVSMDVAQVLYRTPNHAMTAVEKLHAHTFKGAQISVVLKKRADGVAKLQAHMRPETKDKRERIQKKIEEEKEKAKVIKEIVTDRSLKGAEVNRGSRLIIRNLPFDVTDRDLRAIFLPYGPIYSIDVPQKIAAVKQEKQDTLKEVQDVEMEEGEASSESEDEGSSSEEESGEDSDGSEDDSDEESASSSSSASSASVAVDAEKTEQSNVPTNKGRGFAFVWMVSRGDAEKAIKGVNGLTIGRGAAEKAQLKAAKGKAGRDAAKKALEATVQTSQPGRSVAVDWALSKKEWELKKEESEAEETDKEEEQDDDSDTDPIKMDEDERDSDEEEEEQDKPSLPSPSEQTTLFIRNLPYQATEAELRDVFRAFGPLRYAKVTMDKTTNRAKGTGFVCFWQKESADNAIRQAQLVEREVGGTASTSVVGQKNPFSAPSILTADPSAPLTSSLNLHGRVLSITLAVEKDKADTLTNKNRSAREKTDRRNTYLMREGVPLPGTSLAATMSEKEVEKRLASFTMRKTQLSKNPSLFVSKTRLSVRQLPLYVSQKMLKKLGIYAVREFDAQVKRGEREDVSEEDKADSQALMQEVQFNKSVTNDGEDAEMSKKKYKKFVGEQSTAVIQSKVMLQPDRIDPITGMGRSRGYGFLEMRSYVDALKLVRFVNGEKLLTKILIKWYESELQGMVKGLQRDVNLDESESSTAKVEEKEERQSRLKRVEKRLAQIQAGQVDSAEEGGRGGSIVVEFSIENIIVTKKRKERADYSQGKANKRKRSGDDDYQAKEGGFPSQAAEFKKAMPKRPRFDDNDKGAGSKRDQKRIPRRENWNQKTTGTSSGSKDRPAPSKEPAAVKAVPSNPMGSLIGRKRKEKKGRK